MSEGEALHVCGWNADEIDKPPLLFVHGFRANAHWWDHVAPSFMPRARVFAMDFSGMGRSARRASYERAQFVADIVAVGRWLKAAAPGRPLTVVGHSFGGLRMLEACALAPDIIDHAVVVDSLIRMPGDVALRPRQLGRPTPYPSRQAALDRFRLLPDQPKLDYIHAYIAQHSIRAVPGGWTWQFDTRIPATLDFGISEDGLRSIRQTVDIVRGEHSKILHADRARRVAGLVPGIRRVEVIPEGHHHLMIDQPLALIDMLKSLTAR